MTINAEFDWRRFPETERWVEEHLASAVAAVPFLSQLQSRMQTETGTRLQHWVDHLALGTSRVSEDELVGLGYEHVAGEVGSVWRHDGGMFPRVRIIAGDALHVALKVDSVAEFLSAHQIDTDIEGGPRTPLRKAVVAESGAVAVSVFERHGYLGFEPVDVDPQQAERVLWWKQSFELRCRFYPTDEEAFESLLESIDAAKEELGVDWAAALFFAAERDYWQARNQAARVQWERQNHLGLGWANHDHHTYRSSREHFHRLIEVLERLGMRCRERFYGGAEAGWGAQVLEQPVAGVVVFADVDLSAEEVTGDFAHQGLTARDTLGTVGLWCKLHGEAILQAGMHHLECQFDFDAARDQLASQGIDSMDPFTNFDHLKQSFTRGERWAVSEERLQRALDAGWITDQQADQFRREGCIGSHLEVLQRRDGYKGFNQTGISEIIRQTDPRRRAMTGADES